MKPVGNISIPAGSRSTISMLTAFGFSPSRLCRCSGSTWALVCGSSGSSQARCFQDASGGPCCPTHPSSGRVSSVCCCITKTHHSPGYQAASIRKAGLAPHFMMLENSNALSLVTNANQWATGNGSSDLHHSENHIIGQKKLYINKMKHTRKHSPCHLSSIPNARQCWLLKVAMNYLYDELSFFLPS